MSSAALEFWAGSGLVLVLVALLLFAFVFGPQAIREWREIFLDNERSV